MEELDPIDRSTYVEVVSTFLHDVVRADVVAWNVIDLRRRVVEVVGSAASRLAPDTAARLLAADDHPMVRSFVRDAGKPGIAPPRLLSDLVTPAALRATGAWRTVIEPTSGEHQVAVMLTPVTESGGRAWSISRRSPDFTRSDVAHLERVQPVLVMLDLAYGRASGEGGGAVDVGAAMRHGLTEREVEVLELVHFGLTSAAAGRRLGISGRTVDKHLQSVYGKLGVTNRVSALTALAPDPEGNPS